MRSMRVTARSTGVIVGLTIAVRFGPMFVSTCL